MIDFNFRAFDDVDGLVNAVSASCKKRNVDEGRKLVSLVLNKRQLTTVANYSAIKVSQSERLH